MKHVKLQQNVDLSLNSEIFTFRGAMECEKKNSNKINFELNQRRTE